MRAITGSPRFLQAPRRRTPTTCGPSTGSRTPTWTRSSPCWRWAPLPPCFIPSPEFSDFRCHPPSDVQLLSFKFGRKFKASRGPWYSDGNLFVNSHCHPTKLNFRKNFSQGELADFFQCVWLSQTCNTFLQKNSVSSHSFISLPSTLICPKFWTTRFEIPQHLGCELT